MYIRNWLFLNASRRFFPEMSGIPFHPREVLSYALESGNQQHTRNTFLHYRTDKVSHQHWFLPMGFEERGRTFCSTNWKCACLWLPSWQRSGVWSVCGVKVLKQKNWGQPLDLREELGEFCLHVKEAAWTGAANIMLSTTDTGHIIFELDNSPSRYPVVERNTFRHCCINVRHEMGKEKWQANPFFMPSQRLALQHSLSGTGRNWHCKCGGYAFQQPKVYSSRCNVSSEHFQWQSDSQASSMLGQCEWPDESSFPKVNKWGWWWQW